MNVHIKWHNEVSNAIANGVGGREGVIRTFEEKKVQQHPHSE